MEKPIRKPIQLSEELHTKVSEFAKANNISMNDVVEIAFKKLTQDLHKSISKPKITHANIHLFKSLVAIKDGEILDVEIAIGEHYTIGVYNEDYAILLDSFNEQIMINFRKINDWFEVGIMNESEEIEGALTFETIKEHEILIAKKSGTFNKTKIVKGYEYPIIKNTVTHVFFQMPNFDENMIKYDLINQWFTGK